MKREEAEQRADVLAKAIQNLQVSCGAPSLMFVASFWGEHGVFCADVLHGPQFKWRDEEAGKQLEVGLLSSLLGMIEAQCAKMRREGIEQYGDVFNEAVNTDKAQYLRQWSGRDN
jgi:hypothetical protein